MVGQYFGHLQDSWVVHLFVVFRSVLHSVSYEAGNTTEASREVPLSASVFNQKKIVRHLWKEVIGMRHAIRCNIVS